MTILCGTDFTPAAAEGVETAALLAARLGHPLHLVHVLEQPGAAESMAERAWPPTRGRMHVEGERAEKEEKLRAEGARTGARVSVSTAVLLGHPDEAIVTEAERVQAKLVVIGAIGRRGGSPWSLGSTADRVAQTSKRPVLVVRKPAAFAAWSSERPLRIVVGVEASPASDAAVAWIENLRAGGPCTAIAAHVYWPPEQRERLQMRGGIPIGKGHPEVEASLSTELRARLSSLASGTAPELRIVGGMGRTADHLLQIAEEEQADLIAVGARRRSGFDRLWHGSVSHGVIAGAPISALSVPPS